MKKISKKNKNFNKNQKSFYFEDYLEKNKKNDPSLNNNLFHDRIYLLFFFIFFFNFYFSIRIINVSLTNIELFKQTSIKQFTLNRRDIVDRNGVLISRNIKSYHAAINPNLIKNKKKFLIKLRINFPDMQMKEFKKK